MGVARQVVHRTGPRESVPRQHQLHVGGARLLVAEVAVFRLLLAMVLTLSCGFACSPAQAIIDRMPSAIDPWDSIPGARCTVRQASSNPLVVDWPASARGTLERRLHRGLVVVRYQGCELEVLRRCHVPDASYTYGGFTHKSEQVRIRDADELYANLPVGAAKLEAKLQRAEALTISLTLVGMYEAGQEVVTWDELRGQCEGATHVLSAATVGAYSIQLEHQALIGAAAGLRGGPALGGESEVSRETLAADGDAASCIEVAEPHSGPPAGCGALIRLEVTPLGEAVADNVECPATMSWNGRQCQSNVGPAPARCPMSMAAIPGGTWQGESIPAMCLDLVEVRVADYRVCVSDGACARPGSSAWWPGIRPAEHEVSREQCNGARDDREQHPINCITLRQAESYCAWRGARLPTDAQWAWAARGGAQARTYPWGAAIPSRHRVNACGAECRQWFKKLGHARRRVAYEGDDGWPLTAPVGSFPAGQSLFGPLDLAGNVAEWTSTALEVEEEEGEGARQRVRGGSFWVQRRAWLQTDDTTAVARNRRDVVIGFRCAL